MSPAVSLSPFSKFPCPCPCSVHVPASSLYIYKQSKRTEKECIRRELLKHGVSTLLTLCCWHAIRRIHTMLTPQKECKVRITWSLPQGPDPPSSAPPQESVAKDRGPIVWLSPYSATALYAMSVARLISSRAPVYAHKNQDHFLILTWIIAC